MPIFPVGLGVVQRGTRRFGVEVIVKLHAVNRVVFHHFGNDAGYPVADFWNPRVEDKAVAGGTDPVAMQHEDAGGDLRQGSVEFADGFWPGVHRDAIGVKPGMDPHTAFVGFIEHKLERIVARILADVAGEHIGPRQNF